jgi:signal transduction histidine kinase
MPEKSDLNFNDLGGEEAKDGDEKIALEISSEINENWRNNLFPKIREAFEEITEKIGIIKQAIGENKKITDEQISEINDLIPKTDSVISNLFGQSDSDDAKTNVIMGLAQNMRVHRFGNLIQGPLYKLGEKINSIKNSNELRSDELDLPDINAALSQLEVKPNELMLRSENLIKKTKTSVWMLGKAAERQGVELRFNTETNKEIYAKNYSCLLRESLMELIQNAMHHTPPGGKIDVSVEEHDGSAVITISDTGAGIPAENLPHIFEQGFTTRETGTGKGLAYIKKYFEEIAGGKVEVASEVGKGTTFTITLPQCEKPTAGVKELSADDE